MKEIWKEIEGFNNYQVSTLGRVKRTTWSRNSPAGKILKPSKNNCGYLFVNLQKNKKAYRKSIHRLIAEAFIDNPNNLTDVDHIDNNKLNNTVENLQWLSHKDNMNKMLKEYKDEIYQKAKHTRYLKKLNNQKPKKIRCYIFDNKIFINFDSVSKYMNLSKKQIRYYFEKKNIIFKKDYVLLLLNGKIQNIEDKYGNSINIDVNNVKFYNNKDKYIYN